MLERIARLGTVHPIGVQPHLSPPMLVEDYCGEMARRDDYVWLFGVPIVQATSIASCARLPPEAVLGFASGGTQEGVRSI